MTKNDDLMVTVCASCLRASCWHYLLICADYGQANITKKSIAELRLLKLEHPSYWDVEWPTDD